MKNLEKNLENNFVSREECGLEKHPKHEVQDPTCFFRQLENLQKKILR